ncbi:hypothetical protein [Halorussus caseinilyticus]|uniref:Uncharacterized protein n=1 Tax=Halorussus caseinilyticus TaxID=3034025 RepID=A0ABD5WEQ8_9EURY
MTGERGDATRRGDDADTGGSGADDGDERVVAVVTGTRAEYGLLQSSMAAIRDTEGWRSEPSPPGCTSRPNTATPSRRFGPTAST